MTPVWGSALTDSDGSLWCFHYIALPTITRPLAVHHDRRRNRAARILCHRESIYSTIQSFSAAMPLDHPRCTTNNHSPSLPRQVARPGRAPQQLVPLGVHLPYHSVNWPHNATRSPSMSPDFNLKFLKGERRPWSSWPVAPPTCTTSPRRCHDIREIG